MARSFKISFPLPRRPSASAQTTPGSQNSHRSNVDESPLSHPGEKAERILGASEPDGKESKKKQTRKEKKQLRKYPSFMSVTLSDIDGESVRAVDGFPFPGMQTPSETSRRPTHDENRQGSSPFLGEQYTMVSADVDNTSDASRPEAQRAVSSSTLRSHYDPKKSPLSVSQQTSASSTRDMALRKGYTPISSPLSHNIVEAARSTKSDKFHSRQVSADSKVSGSSKLSGNSIKRIAGTPRRRPSITDPPTLYPNANRTFHAVSPPPALINSSLPKPLFPGAPQTAPFSRLRWWERGKLKTSPPISPPITIEEKQDHRSYDESFSSVKVNVKRPRAGMRNWFDGIEDEELTLEELQHPELSKYQMGDRHEPPSSIHEIMSQGPLPLQITARKSSFSSRNPQTTAPGRKLSFRLESPNGQISHGRSSQQSLSQPSETRNTLGRYSGGSTRGTVRSKGVHSGMDLKVESFLELSSSEDEGENSAGLEAPYHRHRIRASIEPAGYNNEVLIGNAQRLQHVKPRPVVNRFSQRPLSRRSNNSETVPPVPKIPDRPKLSQRTSSIRWREMMGEKAGSIEAGESTVDSGESSQNGNPNARRISSRPKRKQNVRGSKLMKVTSEEEKLLEAMREKRASIRKNDFEKGFKTAMQLNGGRDVVPRPKTAGVDGRISLSSGYGSRSSVSPPPEYGIKRTLTGSRLSASTDDLRFDDAYPFPKVPERLKSPVGFASPAKQSPSLSFSLSDILSSTPTSRDSPLTPPPGQGSLGAYGGGINVSPSRSVQIMNQLGHDRKRTVSSSVVMLDGVEQHAQVLDEENGITGWATDRW
ncbi:hypothetical protein MMC28_010142 [Mycoblastus sanguinarius]|nr:hypothetical protein [Mycoblastus sanguinarius]